MSAFDLLLAEQRKVLQPYPLLDKKWKYDSHITQISSRTFNQWSIFLSVASDSGVFFIMPKALQILFL